MVRMPKDVTFVDRYYDLLRLPFDYLTSTDEHLDFGDVQDSFTFFHSNVIKKLYHTSIFKFIITPDLLYRNKPIAEYSIYLI